MRQGTAAEATTDSHLSILTPAKLAYRRRRGADPHAPEDGRCRFGVGPGERADCKEEATYEWHATRSDVSGRPGVDWHYELTEALCDRHAIERMGPVPVPEQEEPTR